MDDNPFALLITWTCYGTWLPGDERGFISNQVLADGGYIKKINAPAVPPLRGDAHARKKSKELQAHASVSLDQPQAIIVARAMVDACRVRSWRILRVAIMATHVHTIVVDCPDDGPAVRRVLKGVSQAALSNEAVQSRRWWTSGGSNRYLHGHQSIENADRYVADQEFKLVEIFDMAIGTESGLPRRI